METTKNPSGKCCRKKQGLPLGKLALAFLVYKARERVSSTIAHRLPAESALSCSATCPSSSQPSLTLPCPPAGPPLMHRESSAPFWPLSCLLFTQECLLLIATATARLPSLFGGGPIAAARSICKPTALSSPPLPWDVWGDSVPHHSVCMMWPSE